jgi:predicted regulator of Ras-like GTPase activity (Roadblock/LC7/MglB family)
MDQDQCHSLGTSHQSGWLVELKASLDAVDSIDGLVVGSNLAVAVDSSLVAPVAAVAVDSKLVAAALGSNLVAEVAVAGVAVAGVAVVAEAGSAVFEWEPQGEEAMMFSRLLEKT